MSRKRRLAILKFTYDEVLDATKHQDDKIHRLLTAIAFLTAGALAVAGLGSAKYLTLHYEFGHGQAPLALVAVGVFFVGVVVTALMLVGSLTTPLRLPGAPKRSNRVDPGPPATEPYWANPEVCASPFYFFEVAELSLGQWQEKWTKPTTKELEHEEFDALMRETHNLAVRTAFKYKLTTEAVAVLSFALASLAVAAVLVLVAAGYGKGLVPLAWPARGALSFVIGGYVWLQIRGSLQSRIQTVEEMHWLYENGRRRRILRASFPVSAGVVPILLTSVESESWLWCLAMTFVPLVPLWLFWRIRHDAPGRPIPDPGGSRSTGGRRQSPVTVAGLLAVVLGATCWLSAASGHPEVRLIAAYATTVVVLIAALTGSRGALMARLAAFEKSVREHPQQDGTVASSIRHDPPGKP